MVIPMFTGKARDVVTNTFHFVDELDGAPESAALEIQAQLNAFYFDVYGSVATDRANYMNWAAASIKVARLEDPTPRPIYEVPGPWSNAGSATTSIPTEMAIVASWKAAPVAGIRYQSLYNRIYLGGLPNCMTGSSLSSFPVINVTFVDKINAAMKSLRDDFITQDVRWIQYGMNGFGGMGVAREIVGGFVDNSPDSQRRRSVDYSIRTDWVAAP
uniref:Uncharacterized protein n=1 Tax=uncultured prokaryote TaxID=198431 RepID=A0A0H5Q5M3_9ZZZZ|nr:hypothetical protein [uncultured prokaryote]